MDQNAFLHTICAHPDDDAPRLVYADWLDERGDPRGEFIRVQCELAGLREDDPKWTALKEREQTLLSQHHEKWLKEIPEWAREDVEFHRGFVDSVAVGIRNLLEQGNVEALFATCPLQALRIYGFSGLPSYDLRQ